MHNACTLARTYHSSYSAFRETEYQDIIFPFIARQVHSLIKIVFVFYLKTNKHIFISNTCTQVLQIAAITIQIGKEECNQKYHEFIPHV